MLKKLPRRHLVESKGEFELSGSMKSLIVILRLLLFADLCQKPSQLMLCAVHFPIKRNVGHVPRLFEERSFFT